MSLASMRFTNQIHISNGGNSVIRKRLQALDGETCTGAVIIAAIEMDNAWGIGKLLARANPSTFDVFQGTFSTVKTKGGNCLTS